MRKICLGLLFLACCFGQDSVTIRASRSLTPQPDEVVFAVNVTAIMNVDLDGVLAALNGTGITAANLQSIYSYLSTTGSGRNLQTQQTLQWSFRLTVPFSKVQDTVAMLNGLEESIVKNNSGLQLSYNAQGTTTSSQPSCPIPDLIADARAQAQTVASAAGATVGPILALSDADVPVPALAQRTAYVFAIAPNLQLTLSTVFGVPAFAPPIPASCAIVVKFGLLRG